MRLSVQVVLVGLLLALAGVKYYTWHRAEVMEPKPGVEVPDPSRSGASATEDDEGLVKETDENPGVKGTAGDSDVRAVDEGEELRVSWQPLRESYSEEELREMSKFEMVVDDGTIVEVSLLVKPQANITESELLLVSERFAGLYWDQLEAQQRVLEREVAAGAQTFSTHEALAEAIQEQGSDKVQGKKCSKLDRFVLVEVGTLSGDPTVRELRDEMLRIQQEYGVRARCINHQ